MTYRTQDGIFPHISISRPNRRKVLLANPRGDVAYWANTWVPQARAILGRWLNHRPLPHLIEADDVIQESLELAWTWSQKTRAIPSPAFLRAICHNLLVSLYRKANSAPPRSTATLFDVDQYVGQPDDALRAIEWQVTLESILTRHEHDWVWQHEVYGISLGRLSRDYGLSATALKTRLHRARLKVRKSLSDYQLMS